MIVERNANLGKGDICEELALSKFGPAVDSFTKAFDGEFSIVKRSVTQTTEFHSAMGSLSEQEETARGELKAYFDEVHTRGCDK
jgi:hypothetical protein